MLGGDGAPRRAGLLRRKATVPPSICRHAGAARHAAARRWRPPAGPPAASPSCIALAGRVFGVLVRQPTLAAQRATAGAHGSACRQGRLCHRDGLAAAVRPVVVSGGEQPAARPGPFPAQAAHQTSRPPDGTQWAGRANASLLAGWSPPSAECRVLSADRRRSRSPAWQVWGTAGPEPPGGPARGPGVHAAEGVGGQHEQRGCQ